MSQSKRNAAASPLPVPNESGEPEFRPPSFEPLKAPAHEAQQERFAPSQRADAHLRLRLHPPRTPLEKLAALLRQHGALALSVGFLILHLFGGYRAEDPPLAQLSVAALLTYLASFVLWRALALRRSRKVAPRHEFALGLALISGVFAAISLSGETASPLYPLLYLLAALIGVAPVSRRLWLGLVAVAVLQNVARYALLGSLLGSWPLLVTQAGFTLVFALIYHLLLASSVWHSHRAEAEAVRRRLLLAEEEALALRLVVADKISEPLRQLTGSQGRTLEEQSERLLLGQILEVDRAVGSLLEGAQLVLNCDAVAFYLLDLEHKELWLREARSRSGELATGPFVVGEGILGSVLQRGRPQVAVGGNVEAHWRPSSWFQGGARIQAMAAVPVLEKMPDSSAHLRGVLVADRQEARPFVEHEHRFLTELATQIVRTIEAERLVGVLHRSRAAQDRLRQIGEEFNELDSPLQVAQLAAELARELVPGLDLAAVSLVLGGEGGALGVALPVNAKLSGDEEAQGERKRNRETAKLSAKGGAASGARAGSQRPVTARAELSKDGASDAAAEEASEDAVPRIHRVLSASGPDSVHYRELEFEDNDGLVSSVSRYGEALPSAAHKPLSRLRIFDDRIRTPASLRVYPLKSGTHIHGSLVVWSRRNAVLDGSALGALGALVPLVSAAMGRVLGWESLAGDEADSL